MHVSLLERNNKSSNDIKPSNDGILNLNNKIINTRSVWSMKLKMHKSTGKQLNISLPKHFAERRSERLATLA